jgi:hypothetical protein
MVNRTIRVDASSTTQVRSIKIGTPVSRVTRSAVKISDLRGIDFSNLSNGSVMVYDPSSGNWVATLDLEEQNISGGQY